MSLRIIFFISLSTMCLIGRGAKYENAEFGFSFQYNEKWKEVSIPQMKYEKNNGRTLVSLQRKQADGSYFSRFSVVVEDGSRFIAKNKDPLLEYANYGWGFLKERQFKQIKMGPAKTVHAGVPAWEIVAKERHSGLIVRQVFLMRGTQGYIISVGTKSDKYESYFPETDMFFRTFVFTDKRSPGKFDGS